MTKKKLEASVDKLVDTIFGLENPNIVKKKVIINRLGLAAYIKLINPDEFVKKTEDGKYVFESEKTGKEWRLAYVKSQFSRYNSELIQLRQL